MPLGDKKPAQAKVEISAPVNEAKSEKPESTPAPAEKSKSRASATGGKKAASRKPKGMPAAASFADLARNFTEKFESSAALEFIPTGSVSFDHILGGGWPRGRMVEIHSPSGMGKSTSMLHSIAQACEDGYNCLVVDAEKAINDSLLEGTGCSQYLGTQLAVIKIDTYSEAEEVIDHFAFSKQGVDLVFLDSITSLAPSKLKSGEMKIEDVEPGLDARLSTVMLKKYKGQAKFKDYCFILINQERTKINFKGPTTVGAAGGQAVGFYPDVRIKMSKAPNGEIMGEDDMKDIQIGQDAFIQTIKNKVTQPYVKSIVSIVFGKGISNVRACTFLLEAEGACQFAGGSYFRVNLGDGDVSCQGRKGVENFIRENEERVVAFLKSRGRI